MSRAAERGGGDPQLGSRVLARRDYRRGRRQGLSGLC